MSPTASPIPPETAPRRDPLAFAEWWEDLIWPKVLTGAGLGLRANRLGVAFFAVVLTAALLGIGTWIDDYLIKEPPVWAVHDGWASIPWRWFVETPILLVRTWPLTTLLFGPLLALAWMVTLGAIARMTAVEASSGRRIPWMEGLGFAAGRWRSLLGAALVPLIVIWFIALLCAAFGAVLLSWPGLNLLGAILFVIPLAFALLAALAAGGFILGFPLLAPAVVCDGADSIDAMQRAFAYVTGRLPRLLFYLLLAAIGVLFVTTVVAIVVGWAVDFAALATSYWTSARGAQAINQGSQLPWPWSPRFFFRAGLEGPPAGTFKGAAGIINFWTAIPAAFAAAAFFASAGAAATVVYLAMRRVCDGQDMAELWTPGAVESAMDESLAGRARVAGEAPPPAPGTPEPLDEPGA
ncbi:MAG: hypothetical protein WD749_03670 [Phycisphaerales bacterium]